MLANGAVDALQRLQLLKQPITEVTWSMHEQDMANNWTALTQEIDDKLGWTIRCIRAIESSRYLAAQRCTQAYPYLHSLIDTSLPNSRDGEQLEPLRLHAIELARNCILQDLREVAADDGTVDEHTQRNRRSRIQEKIVDSNLAPLPLLQCCKRPMEGLSLIRLL